MRWLPSLDSSISASDWKYFFATIPFRSLFFLPCYKIPLKISTCRASTRYNRKLSACGSIMTLWGCVNLLTARMTEAALAATFGGVKCLHQIKFGLNDRNKHHCAIRSPGSMVNCVLTTFRNRNHQLPLIIDQSATTGFGTIPVYGREARAAT